MEVYGLVGNPVAHSLSPPMHEAAYRHLDLPARYVTFEPDPEALGTAISGAAALGVAGLNVTVPFKDAVIEFVEPDDQAARLGAVNTIDFSAGSPPKGHNTDVTGVKRTFEHHDVTLEDEAAVVIGAGGAGRAAAWALHDQGAAVTVANRTVERAETLAADIGGRAVGLNALSEVIPNATRLVNATTVGMESDNSPVPAESLHADLAVLDAVYRPLETRLLRDAAAAGATTIDGAWMLLFQGVAAFEQWTGHDAPVSVMNEALRNAL